MFKRLFEMLKGMQSSDKFDKLFQQHITVSVECGKKLLEFFQNPGENMLPAIEELEHQADTIVAQTHEAINSTFITPYDKEHIEKLIGELDDITDCMKSAARRLTVFGLKEVNTRAVAFCKVAISAVTPLQQMLTLLPKMDSKQICSGVMVINRIEDNADDLRDSCWQDLFSENKHPVTAEELGWKEVYHNLEQMTDHCQHAVVTLLTIAKKAGH